MRRVFLPVLGLGLALGSALGRAQIERLTLEQMILKTDDVVFAEILAKEVIRIDHPVDGPELYFTNLTLRGASLRTGQATTVTVTFPGGFMNDTDGVWNSEAPSDDDVQVGNRVVAFEKYLDNAGGGLACHFLYASHGGLYRTAEGPSGTFVLGRGDGYAVDHNVRLEELEEAVLTIAEKIQKEEL